MKSFKRYLSLLLVALSLLAVFSIPVSAAADDIKVSVWSNESSDPLNVYGSFRVFDTGYIYPSEMGENYVTERNPTHDYLSLVVAVGNSHSSHTFLEGKTYEVTFDGLVFYPLMEFDEYGNWSPQNVVKAVYTQWSDGTNTGTYGFYDAMVIRKTSESTFSLSITFTPTKDIARVYIAIVDDIPDQGYQVGVFNPNLEINELNVLEKIVRGITSSIERIINNNSTLSNIIKNISNSISGLKSAITSPLESLKSEVSKIITSIINIPSNIWNGLNNAIYGLIVPDWYQGTYNSQNNHFLWPTPEEMTDIMTAFDDLLGEVLGPLWSIPEMVIMKYYNTFVIDTPTLDSHIDVPRISLDIVGEKFVLGPYRIPMVPKGLESLTVITKSLSAIIATFGFVSMLFRKIRSILKG